MKKESISIICVRLLITMVSVVIIKELSEFASDIALQATLLSGVISIAIYVSSVLFTMLASIHLLKTTNRYFTDIVNIGGKLTLLFLLLVANLYLFRFPFVFAMTEQWVLFGTTLVVPVILGLWTLTFTHKLVKDTLKSNICPSFNKFMLEMDEE